MKTKLSIFALMLSAWACAQVPTGYYDGTEGLKGYSLKSKLSEIISRNYKDNGYGGLWETYKTSDIDNYYEKDGTIIDIYSENPQGQDPYDFTVGIEQCGASGYKQEGDCYNREHIIPQSSFSQKSPMRNDAHFVLPTDGFVNQRRNRLPFGEVNSPIETFKNGSKIGVNNTAGYGGQVFEPIDEFKGDLARTILYFATRYENEIPTFRKDDIQDGHNQSILDGTKNQSITKWQLDILLKWHNQDPVSQKERDRNEAIYKRQNNRNPYIDNPEWANVVWNYQPPVSTPDTIAPTAPARLTLGEITENSVALTWDASTDNKGVTVYEVYVNGQLKTTSTTPSAVVNGLTPDTLYSFYIIAKDAAGNSSEKSNIVEERTKPTSGTNPTPPTSTPSCGTEDFEKMPSAQSNYAERVWENNGITWTATKAQTQNKNGQSRVITINAGTLTSAGIRDGVGAISVKTHLPYKETSGTIRVKVNGVEKELLNITKDWAQHTINDINAEGTAEIRLEIVSGRISLDDLSWTCYTAPDTEAPSAPTLSTGEISTNTVELNWTAATDNVGVVAYEIYVNGQLNTTSANNSVVINNLSPNTEYNFFIIAKDAAGNSSDRSNVINAKTKDVPDTEAPSAPTLSIGEISSNTVELNWTTANDNVGVVAYEIYVDGQLNTTSANNSVVINNLSPNTEYSFYIIAKDAAGNTSEKSNVINAKTKDVPDTEAPSAPTLSTGEISTNTVELNWTAATDNVGVVAYEIYVDGQLNTTSANNSVIINNLSPNTEYSFYIIAKDAAGNTSEKSNVINAKTKDVPDTKAPSAPTLSTGEISTNTVELNWTAATDNVGVVAYEIYVDGQLNTTSANNSVIINNLSPNTEYSFYIIAKDAAGNTSTKSNILNIKTAKKLVTNEEVRMKKVSVYPNPVAQNGDLYFKNIGQNQSLKIYTMSGRLIREIKSINEDDKINIGNIVPGIYILIIRDQTIKIMVK